MIDAVAVAFAYEVEGREPEPVEMVPTGGSLAAEFPGLTDGEYDRLHWLAYNLSLLKVAPGSRVLEVGTGSGDSAPFLAAMGAGWVASAELDEAAAVEAGRAVAGTWFGDRIAVTCQDGYDGVLRYAPYDRVLVRVGVDGLSRPLVDQLAPTGLIVAPIAHGGLQVLMQIARAGVGDWSAGPGGVLVGRARAVVEVDRALGRLCLSRPRPQGRFAGDVVPPVGRWWPARWTVPLCELEYQSLWCCIAAHLSQVGGGVLEGSATGGRCCLLRDPGGDSVAVLVRNGAIHHAGARGKVLASWLNAEVERWEAFGRPPLSRWRVRFGQVGSPGSGLLVPVQWRLRGIPARASSSARAEVGAFG